MDLVLLSLVMPVDVAERVEDLLLMHPELVPGFTSTLVDGHGSAVRLQAPAEQVSGHAPRQQIQVVGPLEALRSMLELLRADLPHAGVFYWLTPVFEAGRLG